MLVCRYNIDLIISEETIHQREYFTSSTIVDDLVNEGGRKFVFRTSFINVSIINADVDFLLTGIRLETQSVKATG